MTLFWLAVSPQGAWAQPQQAPAVHAVLCSLFIFGGKQVNFHCWCFLLQNLMIKTYCKKKIEKKKKKIKYVSAIQNTFY